MLLPLLSLDCAVTIATVQLRAEALAKSLLATGSVHATADMDKLDGCEFDPSINATSSGIRGEIGDTSVTYSPFPVAMTCSIKREYAISLWCVQQGAKHRYADGLGMLVGQAAHAVFALARCITAGRASD